MERMVNFYGDGIHDDADAIQALLDCGEKNVFIPQGIYLVGKTLRIGSDTVLTLHPNARIISDGRVKKHRGDFLITNSDTSNGNQNISIIGGIWDGNNQGEYNKKPNLFDKFGCSGAVMNFFNVKGLRLSDLTVANSVTYYFRFGCISEFCIENVSIFSEQFRSNQDGLHFSGGVKNGVVKNVRVLSHGQTNDDLIALNADDMVERVENLDLRRDLIENISFENIIAEDCHTIIRLSSVTAPIRNITIKNVCAGYREYAINLDATRYCKTPLFREEDYPHGVGVIENILIENITAYRTKKITASGLERILAYFTKKAHRPAVCLESQVKNFRIKNFKLLEKPDVSRPPIVLLARNIVDTCIESDKGTYRIDNKDQTVEIKDFNEIKINCHNADEEGKI